MSEQPYHLGQEITIPCECSTTATVGCSLCDGTGARALRLGTVTTQLANLAYAQAFESLRKTADGELREAVAELLDALKTMSTGAVTRPTSEELFRRNQAVRRVTALLSDGEAS